MQPQEMDASPMILTPNSAVSPSIMQVQQSPPLNQQRDHGNIYAPARQQVRYNPHQQEHMQNSSYISNNTGYGSRVNFNDQSSTNLQDHQPQRSMSTSMPSGQYQNSQQTNVNWTPPFFSNPSPSATFYATSPQSQSFTSNSAQPYSNSYQLPPPNSQSMLPSHSISHSLHTTFDGLPHRPQYDTTPPIGSQLRTGSLGHPHQLSTHQHQGAFDFLDNNYGHHDADLKADSNSHQG